MNFAKLDISTVTLCKSGKSLKVFDSMKAPLELQSCRMYCPFNPSKFENKWSGMYDYSISCYTEDDFHNFSSKLDKRIEECLGNFTTSELVPSLKENMNYPKLFRLKLPRDSNGNFNVIIFDQDKNKIKLTEDNIDQVFCKKRVFKCIMQCEKITDWNNKASIQWIITQAMYINTNTNTNTRTVIDSDNDNDNGNDVKNLYSTCLL